MEELYAQLGKQKIVEGQIRRREKEKENVTYQNSGKLDEDEKPNKPTKDNKSEPYVANKEMAKKAQASHDTVAKVIYYPVVSL